MRKVYMISSHYPEQNEHGDCLRACVASLYGLDAEDVPHFGADGADGNQMWARVDQWLKRFNMRRWMTAFPGDADLDLVLRAVQALNGDAYYLVGGTTNAGGDHIVVAQGDKIIHDPSRMGSGIQGPASDGYFHIVTFVRDFA